MRSKILAVLIGVAVLLAIGSGPSPARAQSYEPGPPPSIGDILHQCFALYPEPRDRTDIGIGEQVSLWIEPSTWSDPDIEVTPYGQQTVYDGMGPVTWAVISGEGSVYPTTGTSTTLTADLAEFDNTIVVEVSVMDAATFAADGADARKQKLLNSKVPAGLNVIAKADVPPPLMAGTDLIGARTLFILQVQPTTVSFKNVRVQENIPAYPWTWPNGVTDNIPAHIVGPVNVGEGNVDGFTVPNILPDQVATWGAKYTLDFLKDKNTGMFVDFDNPNPTVPFQVEKKNGWETLHTGKAPREWLGATKQGRVGVEKENSMWGGFQGPFKKP